MKYNYLEAVKEDVKEFIRTEIDFREWNGNREGLEEYLNDTLWTEDSVTGNASGSYTFNTWKAEEKAFKKAKKNARGEIISWNCILNIA